MPAERSASHPTGNGTGPLDPDALAAMVGHLESNKRWTRKFRRDVHGFVSALPDDFLEQRPDETSSTARPVTGRPITG